MIERGQRRAERQQRPGGDGEQGELDLALGARVEVGEVAVDVARDVGGGEQLAVALDRDVGERLQRGEAGGVQVAQPVAGARRGDPPGGQPGREDEVDRHPREQRDRGGDVEAEHVDVGRAAPEQGGDLARDERDVGERDQQREPAAAPDVGGAQRGERDEQRVLRERVGQGAEHAGVPARQVQAREDRAEDRVAGEEELEAPFGGMQHGVPADATRARGRRRNRT